ncbi:unnamed protein product [Brassicogethes aeneus]|uniref:Protein-L-isoaspartate O-methyltransferase domain-containing protein 1 n=1 Tax=Brassicogethes aeneus TaxID=1431903 RepID=A0A9P0B1G0_BRAAE|nr:unnamed protein product [Brassicogethes aeneus]
MGGVVSSGQSNDDLIDNLLEADYIKTSDIERVFRAVDRANYFLPEARTHAYKDLAWKTGNLHLSAPCIYSEVMEGLHLKPGLSFLNIGSGTGYLSTMAGLVLGINGVNHGVEIFDDVIQYANKKLEEFKRHSGTMDEFEFCEPKFKQGNCLCLGNISGQYDRIYCGAACPESFEPFLKNVIKIGGILVMPLNDQLLQVKRSDEFSWDYTCLLPVSFASMIEPGDNSTEILHIFDIEPPTLQELCRAKIRKLLKNSVESEHLDLLVKKTCTVSNANVKAAKKKRALRRCVVAVFESDESSDEEVSRAYRNRQGDVLNRVDFFNLVLESIENRNGGSRIHPERPPVRRRSNQNEHQNSPRPMDVLYSDSSQDNSERSSPADLSNGSEDKVHKKVHVEVHPNGRPTGGARVVGPADDTPPGSSSARPSPAETPEAGPKRRERSGDERIFERRDVSSTSSEDEQMRDPPEDLDDDAEWEDQTSTDDGQAAERPEAGTKMYKSPYSEHMKKKIHELPLPFLLKRYLNFYRDI